jgi:MFS family permease
LWYRLSINAGFAIGFGEMAAAPTSSAYVAELAPARLRGRYQGAFGLTFALSLILAPALGTRLYAWSPTGLWLTCGAVSVISAALIVRLPGRRIREPFVEPPDVGPEVPGRSASYVWSGVVVRMTSRTRCHGITRRVPSSKTSTP